MGKSLETRLNGKGEAFVQHAREFGIDPAMREYGVKDYLSARNYLERHAKGEYFEFYKADSDSFSQPNAFDKLLQAVLCKYDKQEKRIADLERANAEKDRTIAYYKAIRQHEASGTVQALLQRCDLQQGGQ